MRKGEESESRTSELELDPADIWSIEEMVAEEKDEDKWVRRQKIQEAKSQDLCCVGDEKEVWNREWKIDRQSESQQCVEWRIEEEDNN